MCRGFSKFSKFSHHGYTVKSQNEIEFTQKINVLGLPGITGENNLSIEMEYDFKIIYRSIALMFKHYWEQNSSYFFSYVYVYNTVY